MNEQQVERLIVAMERLTIALETANGQKSDEQLSLKEAADELSVSEVTARRWVKEGRLEAYRPGGKYVIPRSAIEDLKKRIA